MANTLRLFLALWRQITQVPQAARSNGFECLVCIMPYKRVLRWCFKVALPNLKPGVAALELVCTRGDLLSLLPINYLAKKCLLRR